MNNLIEEVMEVVRHPFTHSAHPDVAHIDIVPLTVAAPAPVGVYSARFLVAVARVLTLEGGLVDDPKDPGGLTQWGISQRSYPKVDIRALTRDGAIAIYHADFWTPVAADSMPSAVAYQALDFAVNSGPSTAIRKIQHALGLADDGVWGPITQAAVAKVAPSKMVKLLLAERLDYMRKLANWKDEGSGWAARIAQDLRYGALDT